MSRVLPTRAAAYAASPELALLLACVARLWLMAMPSSLWTDETATAFVARYPDHPSLAIVSPYSHSVYYALPRAMDKMFGFSEIGYRIPSVIAMLLALWFLARLTARLLYPEAAWFAVFAFLAMPGVNYFAIDAKPYALGFCISIAALFFEARWLDSNRWWDALLFVIAAALLWRVQQVYWPFYIALGVFALCRHRSVGLGRMFAVFAVLAFALVPVAIYSAGLLREAGTHAFLAPPRFHDLWQLVLPEWNFVAFAGGAAWLIGRFVKSEPPAGSRKATWTLALSWWLATPIIIFLFSVVSRTSLFTQRYLSLHLAGVALTATIAAAIFLPRAHWRPITLALGTGVLLTSGNWKTLWPEHDPTGWREASRYVNSEADSQTPVLFLSPYVEAASPVWHADYPLPGFLYSPLYAYPLRAKTYLLPFHAGADFHPSPEAMRSAADAVGAANSKLLVYGDVGSVNDWSAWLMQRGKWAAESKQFGDLSVEVLSRR